MEAMQRAGIDHLELAYRIQGSGDAVVLIHWGVCAAWAEPLAREPVLADRHRLLAYHRAGFGASDRAGDPVTMADHAEQCARLMRRLGIERAHVVGHSSSAVIALQLAIDVPGAVQTLTLMEPARPGPETAAQADFARTFVAPAIERYRAGDRPGAVDTFFRGVFGDGYRVPLERGLPGAFEQAVDDADAFFTQELPALQQWQLTQEDAARVTQPVLAVHGERTAATFPERLDLLCSWLPNVERFELPGATHLLHVQSPRRMAAALASFFSRHGAEPVASRGRRAASRT
jgi:pimeloyl-ACP methyl ester carboxylesterase